MPIKKRFDKTIEALKAGHRYLTPLEQDEIEQIKQNLKQDSALLSQSLCLLQNTSSYLPEITPNIIELLNRSQEPNTIVHLLNVARRHTISAYQRDGQRLPPSFLTCLKAKLANKNRNWEVIEWTVRTIDECGSQAIIFKDDLIKIRPGKLAILLNEHKRHTRGIIDMLLQKWRALP